MILYTITPLEQIFPPDEQEMETEQIISCEAGQLIVERINAEQYRIVRLLSGNAMDYLNEKYTPGTIIQVKPQL